MKNKKPIPKFFRAIEKDTRPDIYLGVKIDETETHVHFYGVIISTSESYLKARTIEKAEFKFSPSYLEEFRNKAMEAVSTMKRKELDTRFEFEAAEHIARIGQEIFNQVFKNE